MGKHLFDNAAVEVNYHRHWEHVAASEDAGDEQFRVERVGQVIECARC